jgi:gluconokinase
MGFDFADADDFHPASNVEKMRAGVPLSDADREPWLERLCDLVTERTASGTGFVLACSALRAKYRRILSVGTVVPTFVLLDGTKDLLAARLAARQGHFMPVTLLDSQLDTLEMPEAALKVSIDQPVDRIVSEIQTSLWPVA